MGFRIFFRCDFPLISEIMCLFKVLGQCPKTVTKLFCHKMTNTVSVTFKCLNFFSESLKLQSYTRKLQYAADFSESHLKPKDKSQKSIPPVYHLNKYYTIPVLWLHFALASNTHKSVPNTHRHAGTQKAPRKRKNSVYTSITLSRSRLGIRREMQGIQGKSQIRKQWDIDLFGAFYCSRLSYAFSGHATP